MKHYFLGTAAGYSKKQRVMQRKTHGDDEDTTKLYDFLANEYNGEQVIVTRNGRSAIAAGLKYYHSFLCLPTKKSGVIVNGFTCYAVVQGVKGAGMEPVFADIDRDTLNFTSETLEKAITDDTWAIIVQNTLGNMVNMKEIEKFAKKYNLVIIEDLAHCTGRLYPDGREAGKVGEVVAFSFGKEKSIDVINGGAVVFRNPRMLPVSVPKKAPEGADVLRARYYPTFGLIYRKLSYIGLHGLFMRVLVKIGWVRRSADDVIDYRRVKLSDFQAKLALEQLKAKDKLKRRPIRDYYLVTNRDGILKKLAKSGYYFSGFWYERPVSPERYYRKAHFPESQCPEAVFVAKHIINFPSYYSASELAPARRLVKENLVEDEDE